MKKLFLPALLMFMFAFLSAQIPNADMELWTSAPTLISWQTNSYPLTLPPYDPYVVRKDSDRYSGLWAADYYGNGVFKPWGIAVFPVTQHPVALSLYYKLLFAPCVNQQNDTLNDTATVSIELMSNGAVVDQGSWQSTTPNSSYSELIVPLSQNATVFDSCRITVTGGMLSTSCGGAVWHTEFKVDHFQLLYSNGQSCIDSSHICDTCICNGPYQPVCGCNGVTYVNSCAAYSAGVSSWNAGSCSSNGCIDSSRICDTCICPLYVYPVCGCNGVTYINSCYAQSAGVLYWTTGSCMNTGGCTADFTYIQDSTGLGISFEDASTGSYDSLQWSFGDSSSVTSGVVPVHHVYAGSGLYNVCLTIFSADSSCYNTECQTLVVAPPGPCPDTALEQPGYTCGNTFAPVCGCNGVTYNNACEAFYHNGVTSFTQGACQVPVLCYAYYFYWLDSTGYTIYFQYSGAGNSGTVGNPNASLLWNFGDGTTDTGQYPVHTFTDTSVHAWWVCLTVSDTIDSCTSNYCDSVKTGRQVPGCYAGFGYNIDPNGLVTVYPDPINGGAVTGSGWIVGGDTTNGPPTFVIDSNNNFNICYVVSNDSIQCSDTSCINAYQIYQAYRLTNIQAISGQQAQLYLYPNPTANSVQMRFITNAGGMADIAVRNMIGEAVYQFVEFRLNPGSFQYTLDLTGLSSGVYLVEFRLNNSVTVVRKLVKL